MNTSELPVIAQAFMKALSAGDRTGVKHSLATGFAPEAFERRSLDQIQTSLEEVLALSGGLEIELLSTQPHMAQALLTTKSAIQDFRGVNTPRTMYFEVNIAPAGAAHASKVVDFALLAVPPGSLAAEMKFTDVPANDSSAVDEIRLKLDSFAGHDLFSGTAIVARGDRVLWQAAYGEAEKNHHSANTMHSRFHMASVTKMFTAVAMAQLVEAGNLRFDNRLIEAWPDYPNRTVAEKITIGQMLTHTSGLGEGLTPPIQKADTPYRTLRDAIFVNAESPLLFEPGSNWGYSNLGYMVLGRVIELLSDTSYEGYVEKHILAPAGMVETENIDVTRVVPALAVGYSRQADDPLGIRERHSNWPLILGFRGTSAGGYYSTAPDMLKFMRALRTYQLLSQEMSETVTSGKYQLSPALQYAYGGWERSWKGKSIRGNGGGGLGYGINNEANTIWTPSGEQSDWTVILLSNYDPPVTQDFSLAALHYLTLR
jgi:CubicO group peptidase (beta-lactamase class C family)